MTFKNDTTLIFYLEDEYFDKFQKEMLENYPLLNSSSLKATRIIDLILDMISQTLNIKEYIFGYSGAKVYNSLDNDGITFQFMLSSPEDEQKLKSVVNHNFLMQAALQLIEQIPEKSSTPAPIPFLPPNNLWNSIPGEFAEYGEYLKPESALSIIKALVESHFLNKEISNNSNPTKSLKV